MSQHRAEVRARLPKTRWSLIRGANRYPEKDTTSADSQATLGYASRAMSIDDKDRRAYRSIRRQLPRDNRFSIGPWFGASLDLPTSMQTLPGAIES